MSPLDYEPKPAYRAIGGVNSFNNGSLPFRFDPASMQRSHSALADGEGDKRAEYPRNVSS